MPRYLIAYDIADSHCREKAAKKILKHGRRLQKSLFITEMTDAARDRLMKELLTTIGDDDELMLFPLCEGCYAKALTAGDLPEEALF